jgi:hypothetical protein
LIFTITLRLQIINAAALRKYVSETVMPEYGLTADDGEGLNIAETLGWIFNSGASFPARNTDPCLRLRRGSPCRQDRAAGGSGRVPASRIHALVTMAARGLEGTGRL